MTITYLNDFDYTDHELANLILKDVKLAEAPANPEPYDIYRLPDGTPAYVNTAGITRPIHEDSLIEISGTGPLSFITNGRSVQGAILPADVTNPGTLSPEHYALLAGATASNVAGTIMLRGADGYTEMQELAATTAVYTPVVRGLRLTDIGIADAVPRQYVDTLVQNAVRDAIAGFDRKAQGVRVAVGVNTPISSTFGTFDGVAIAATDANRSILLYNQTNPAENGAFDVTASGLVRRADSNTTVNLTNGASYQVEDGSNANHVFTLITQNGFTIGTDSLTFLDISGVNVLRSGDGVSIINQQINARTTIDRTFVNADGNIDIAPAYDALTDSKIAAAIAPLQNAGEVQTLINTALTDYSAVSEYSTPVGDGVATTFTVTHNLNNLFPSAMGFYKGSALGSLDYSPAGPNAITVRASLGQNPISAGSLIVVVQAKKY